MQFKANIVGSRGWRSVAWAGCCLLASPVAVAAQELIATQAAMAQVAGTGVTTASDAKPAEIVATSTGEARRAGSGVDSLKLLDLLVAKGLISRPEADALIAAATPGPRPTQAGGVDGEVQTVPYIPKIVRDQIRSEVLAETRAEAVKAGWAAPSQVAEWTRRIALFGDFRMRWESDLFASDNSPIIPNFSALNAGSPFNANPNSASYVNAPVLNTRHDRQRWRIRARAGLRAAITDEITTEVRLASGNDSQPLSTNQTLGGGNGNFSKYALWLDTALVRYAPKSGPLDGLTLVAGRAPNPFWTTDLIFHKDLQFDGISSAYEHSLLSPDLRTFATVGAFPTYSTDMNFGSRDVLSYASRDRWLLAAQTGAKWSPNPALMVTAAAGVFVFSDVKGKLSAPCLVTTDVCSTDNTRPLFQQYGNSLMLIRNDLADPTVAAGASPMPQYFGLASNFTVVDLHGAVETKIARDIPIRLDVDVIENVTFHRAMVKSLQVNVVGDYHPANTGYHVTVGVGKTTPSRFGDLGASLSYKRLDTDATIDGLTDSDFHLGGANARGYILNGVLGLGGTAAFSVKWFSAQQVTGQPYSVDVLQTDLSVRF